MRPSRAGVLWTCVVLSAVASCVAPQRDEQGRPPSVGTLTARPLFVEPGEGRQFALSDTNVAEILVASDLGDFSLFEQSVAANPARVPLHRHNSYDEGFFVLEGQIEVVAGNESHRCSRGVFAFIPRGVSHTFSNPGPPPARILVIGSSGIQSLVEDVAPLVNAPAPDIDKIVAAFSRHDSVLLLPSK